MRQPRKHSCFCEQRRLSRAETTDYGAWVLIFVMPTRKLMVKLLMISAVEIATAVEHQSRRSPINISTMSYPVRRNGPAGSTVTFSLLLRATPSASGHGRSLVL